MDLSFIPKANWVDIIVVILLIRGGYIGLSRGFSVELFKTLGAIAACVLSLLYYERLGQWLVLRSFLSLQVASIISFIVLVLLLIFIFRVLRILIFKVLRIELSYDLEKWGGLGLGLARSIVYLSLFLILLTLIPLPYFKHTVEEDSFSGPYLKSVSPKLLKFVMKFRPKEYKGVE